jgi:hypothetical protein
MREAWNPARDRCQTFPVVTPRRDRGEKRSRIGVLGLLVQREDIALLYRPAGVHHDHLVAQLGDDT